MQEQVWKPGVRTRLTAIVHTVGVLAACGFACAQPPERLALEPPDDRPVFAVPVSDMDEVDLLEQRLDLRVLRFEDGLLYFTAEPARLETLAGLGYSAEAQDPIEFYRRVVRLFPREGQTTIAGEIVDALDLQLINREDRYWIVLGSLRQLRAAQDRGFGLADVSGNEPRPRTVRIVAASEEALAEILEPDLDVYSVAPRGPSPDDGFLIDAGAFDYQIDSLRGRGFAVEILEEP